MKYVLPFDHVLTTPAGLAIAFAANVPVHVPDESRQAALDLGAVESDEPDDLAPGNQMPSDVGAAA